MPRIHGDGRPHTPWLLRAARDEDARSIIALIGSVFDEYEGCILDVEREEPELLAVATAYAKKAGLFWVATHESEVVGCVGLVQHSAGAVELKKLYVRRRHRRLGLGSGLCALVEEEAKLRGCARVHLWSDSRFESAHQFYVSRGYVLTGKSRELGDLSNTTEFEFERHFLASAPARGPNVQ